ncbi:MAG: DegV family EDD domain-containing protein [Anaerolineae bacterium]|nr:DegV family EDD domain-containing protein [Anaerolineae bacterium]
MNPICIITDSTAQFPQPSFPGRHLVRVIPLTVEVNGKKCEQFDEVKPNSLPLYASQTISPQLKAPPPEYFSQIFSELNLTCRETLCIFLSAELSLCCSNAAEAARTQRGTIAHIIDSQTTSIGLGILVQAAAEAASKGLPLIEIDKLVRSLIPRIYAVFGIPGLSYLHHNGFVDRAQAFVCEMLGLYTIFSLEDGKLSPIEKVRNQRHVLDYFQEFLDEFDYLQHIALLQSAPANPQDAHLIREHIQQCFPRSPFTAHPINLPLATLFGPRTLGIFAVEGGNFRRR